MVQIMAFRDANPDEYTFDRGIFVGLRGQTTIDLMYMGHQEMSQADLRFAAAYILNAVCTESELPWHEEMEFVEEQAKMLGDI